MPHHSSVSSPVLHDTLTYHTPYLIQMLPMVVREVWIVADALLDRYEYAGSSIYSEYPDKVTILKIADMVYDKLKYREEQEMIQTNYEAIFKIVTLSGYSE